MSVPHCIQPLLSMKWPSVSHKRSVSGRIESLHSLHHMILEPWSTTSYHINLADWVVLVNYEVQAPRAGDLISESGQRNVPRIPSLATPPGNLRRYVAIMGKRKWADSCMLRWVTCQTSHARARICLTHGGRTQPTVQRRPLKKTEK